MADIKIGDRVRGKIIGSCRDSMTGTVAAIHRQWAWLDLNDDDCGVLAPLSGLTVLPRPMRGNLIKPGSWFASNEPRPGCSYESIEAVELTAEVRARIADLL